MSKRSAIDTFQVGSVSQQRLIKQIGMLSDATIEEVSKSLGIGLILSSEDIRSNISKIDYNHQQMQLPNTRISIDKSLPGSEDSISSQAAFLLADNMLIACIRPLIDIISTQNGDFADIRSVLADAGLASFGIGQGEGKLRAKDAALQAINSSLLEGSIEGARGVVMTVTGGADMTLMELTTAADTIYEVVDPNANIIFGAVVDESMEGKIQVSIIATGFTNI